jgi:hypothetical protein
MHSYPSGCDMPIISLDSVCRPLAQLSKVIENGNSKRGRGQAKLNFS